MFKRLKTKFLFMHMGIVFLLVLIFFFTIFTFAYQNVERMSDDMLGKAMHNSVPPIPKNEENIKPKFTPLITIELGEQNEIKNIIGFNTFSEEFYEKIVSLAKSEHKSDLIKYEGAYFKFRILDDKIIFMDISKEFQMLYNLLFTFLFIAIPILFLIFLISLYFANKAIKPIEVAYNKQQEFISDASHELKTPLTTISTNADLLLNSANDEQVKWLGYIKNETKRMTELTESLLYLTKMDYSKENISQKIKFDQLLNDVLLPLEAVFYEKKIKLDVDISDDIEVFGDKEQLRRMINIFIDNAIKYTDKNIIISLEKTQNNAILMVFNTGAGIEKEELMKIWERFYRCDKSRKYTGGFGLGLPIAKAIISKHKGTITAQSEYEKWTKFIIKLPLAK